MTRLLLALLLVGGVAWTAATLTVTPRSHDFGPTVLRGVSLREFTVAWDRPREAVEARIVGPHATDFDFSETSRAQEHFLTCEDRNYQPTSPCPLDLNFRPSALGLRTATLIVIDRHGHRVTAALRGEGVKAGCQPVLVHCNYANLYSGTISLSSVDTVLTEDHQARSEVEIEIAVTLGQVQCTGYRREFERSGYKGEMDTEIKGEGSISGPGLLAIEFDYRERQPVYILTFACPAPAMKRTNIALKAGTATEQRFPAEPADWGGSEMVADPQPSSEPMMSPLQGSFRHGRLDPENSSGGYTRTSWNLRRP